MVNLENRFQSSKGLSVKDLDSEFRSFFAVSEQSLKS